MKALLVEDDFTSRILLQQLLLPYLETHIAVNGKEAVQAFRMSIEGGHPYNLVTLDIMMPEMDGQSTLKQIRKIEQEHGIPVGQGVKVIMTSALQDKRNVLEAFNESCDAYLVKPISKQKLLQHLEHLGLMQPHHAT